MKLLIDIPEEVVTKIQNGEDYRYDIHTTIAQGIPYDPKGDLISREALKEKLKPCEADVCEFSCEGCHFRVVTAEDIDNAPTVEPPKQLVLRARDDAELEQLKTAWGNGEICFTPIVAYTEEPRGTCKTCRHRDPEDKKCDCGGLERQGCPFPVSDDYFCKFYEKGGAT